MGSKTFGTVEVLGLYTETSLHCGAESGTGYVDLPIQRERHTGYPVIQGSTIKGVLRDEVWPDLNGKTREEKIHEIFGSDDAKTPGTVSFGDGILVAFPVRSSGEPFHWITCPFILERTFRLLGVSAALSGLSRGRAWASEPRETLLEELRVQAAAKEDLFKREGPVESLLGLLPSSGFTYTREVFPKRLLVLDDADFGELVETGTEIVTRIKLNYLKTTANLVRDEQPAEIRADLKDADLQGNLFVQELVPPETLFLCSLRANSEVSSFLTALPSVIRLGGDETIGRGVTHLTRTRGRR